MNRFALTDRIMRARIATNRRLYEQRARSIEEDAARGILTIGDTKICADCGAEILLNTWHWDDCKYDMSKAAVEKRERARKIAAIYAEPIDWD